LELIRDEVKLPALKKLLLFGVALFTAMRPFLLIFSTILLIIFTITTIHHSHSLFHAASAHPTAMTHLPIFPSPFTVMFAPAVMTVANGSSQSTQRDYRKTQRDNPHENQFDFAATIAHPLAGFFIVLTGFILFDH